MNGDFLSVEDPGPSLCLGGECPLACAKVSLAVEGARCALGGDLAGAARGSGGVVGGGDSVRHPSGGGEAAADWLVGGACA